MLSVYVFGAAPQEGIPENQIPQTETSCSDSVDNDEDGDTDCADSDCIMDQDCIDHDFNEGNQIEADLTTHSADDINGGTFQGDINFEGSVDFLSTIEIEPEEEYDDYLIYAKHYSGIEDKAAIKGVNHNSDGYGVWGYNLYGPGTYGQSWSGYGLHGYSLSSYGVYAESYNDYALKAKTENEYRCAVVAKNDGSGNDAYLGCASYGLWTADDAHIGGELEVDGGCDGCGNDIAEAFNAAEKLTPGDVVVINQNGEKSLLLSTGSYDTTVAGIVSTNPTIVMGDANEKSVPLALSGVVPTKVSAENGPIEVGDLLTTSNTPGHAMKCDDKRKCFGSLVGKALEPLDKGTGTVIALVMLG